MNRLNFIKDLNHAIEEIKGGTRLALLIFHSPSCEGSMKTLNETLNDEKVIHMIERETAPVLINTVENTRLAKEHRVDWTPAFILIDERGVELERWVGYLPPKDFMAQLLLSKGLADFHLERLDDAIEDFNEIVEDFVDSDLVPEAEYFLGAANQKLTGQNDVLIDISHILASKYPDSQWTKRCSIWAHQKHSAPFVGYDGGGSIGSGAY